MSPFISQALMLITRNNLLDCIALLKEYAAQHKLSRLADSLANIEQNYRFLLKYLAEGSVDPSREKLFNDLRYKLYALIRNLEADEESVASPLLYYSAMRSLRYSKLTFGDALGRFLSIESSLQLMPLRDEKGNLTEDARKLLSEKDRSMKDIFGVIWTLPVGDRRQLDEITGVLADADISFELRSISIAALILSLLRTYDSEKLATLLDIETRTPDQRIRARALTGIVLALARYSDLLQPDFKLDLRFGAWHDDLTNYPRLREVVYSLCKTRGSEKLANKVNTEILPGISGFGADIMKKMADEKGAIDIEELQENPEWEKMMRESGLDKKLRKLHDMHSKGADLTLPMVSQTAGHFFFKEPDAWFRPFDEMEGVRLGIDPDITRLVSEMPNFMSMTDIDRYALLLNLSRVPEANRKMMKSALDSGRDAMNEEMKEELKEIDIHSSQPEFDREALIFARTLFRFFRYFRLHKEFQDPFEDAIPFTRLPYLKDILSEDEILHCLGETYFSQGYYQDAVDVYRELAGRDNRNASMLYQKIGYCLEKDNRPSQALDNYLKAESFRDGTDRWLTERIYSMARKINRVETMLQALDRLIELDKENLAYIEQWLRLMVDLNVYSMYPDRVALFEKRLAKLEYLMPDNPSVLTIRLRSAALKEDYGKVIGISDSRRADIEMYLAASSLGHTGKGGNESKESAETEKSMVEDLLIMADAHAASEDYAAAIADLKLVRMLTHDLSDDDLARRMAATWTSSSVLSSRRLMIPMLLQASLL